MGHQHYSPPRPDIDLPFPERAEQQWDETFALTFEEMERSDLPSGEALEAQFDAFLERKYGQSPENLKRSWERTATRDYIAYQTVQMPDLIEFINERRAARHEEPLSVPGAENRHS